MYIHFWFIYNNGSFKGRDRHH